MTLSGDSSETVEMTSTDMIFEPILEHGVFRFDCSVDHRKAAFPSVSFKNSKDREVPIVSHIVPAYIPTCGCLQDQQVVTFEFSPGTSFYGTGEVSGQLERTGKRVGSFT
jgi:alpha-glucosidase